MVLAVVLAAVLAVPDVAAPNTLSGGARLLSRVVTVKPLRVDKMPKRTSLSQPASSMRRTRGARPAPLRVGISGLVACQRIELVDELGREGALT